MPEIETMGLIGLAVLAALGWFGSWWHRRGHFAMFEESRKWERRTKKARAERDELKSFKRLAEPQLEELEVVTRQRDGYRGIITSVQAERDTWMNLYYSQATGHDNAQRWMMREAQGLAQQITALGGKPKVDPIVQQVRAEFEGEHGVHIAAHKSGEAAGSHERTVQEENAQVAKLDGAVDPEPVPQ